MLDRELSIIANGIRIREGGGCLLAFGLPFFVIGFIFFAGSTGLIPFENADEVPPWGLMGTAMMGAIAMLAGVILTFGRRIVTIDTEIGRVHREQRLFFPVTREQWPLDAFDTVLLREGDDSSSSDGPAQYQVALGGREDQGFLVISRTAVYAIARNRAVTVAEILGFPLHEDCRYAEPAIPPPHLNSPLQELPHALLGPLPEVPRPVNARSQIRTQGQSLLIRIPPPPFHPAKWLLLLIPTFFFTFLLAPIRQFLNETQTPNMVQLVLFSLVALILVLIPVITLLNIFGNSTRMKALAACRTFRVFFSTIAHLGWSETIWAAFD